MLQSILKVGCVFVALALAFFAAPDDLEARERSADIRQEDLIPAKTQERIPEAQKIAELAILAQLYWYGGRPLDAIRIYEGLSRMYGSQFVPGGDPQ